MFCVSLSDETDSETSESQERPLPSANAAPTTTSALVRPQAQRSNFVNHMQINASEAASKDYPPTQLAHSFRSAFLQRMGNRSAGESSAEC